MKNFLVFLVFILVSIFVFGQTNSDTIKYKKIYENSFSDKWSFFQMKDTIEGIVVNYDKLMGACGIYLEASLSIIKISKDTIRVLDICNEEDFKIGQKVKIIPEIAPLDQVEIPSYGIDGNKVDRNKKEIKNIFHSDEFDQKILQTTWAHLVKEK